ncbi:MAG: hypothetical protein H7A17_03505 [Sinobacteraceae bacterium]|nr:hypothetical protein [Nevskiaceae bacterium]MCP5338646.1 hypothetical protein [Nevskiaceae bacterium]MCP5466675.1 hypothetical protein [Nevskiaceae bacterium]
MVRATTDVGLLVRAEDATAIDALLSKLGYRCIHRGADAANCLRGDERLDMLFAHREIARNLLASAATRQCEVLHMTKPCRCATKMPRMRQISF